MRLWSWFWYDDHGTSFVRDWAGSLSVDDWIAFVGTAAAQSLDEVGFVAGRLHLLFHPRQWDETMAAVFDRVLENLRRTKA